jgi:uncharacterized protein
MKKSINTRYAFLIALACLIARLPSLAQGDRLPTIGLSLGGAYRVQAEVARTMEQKAKGLMFREHLGDNEGMLFVYDQPDLHAMWMKNTLIPLSVAFIDEKGVIINVEEMQPQTLDAHAAKKPAKFSLEMNGGWFSKRKIGPGAKILGLEKAPAPK